jgi:hypothetical protein
MGFHGLAQIDVGQYVTVDDDKGFMIPEIACVPDTATGAEDLLFDSDLHRYSKRATLIHKIHDLLVMMVGVDDYFRDAMPSQVFHHTGEDWLVGYGHQGLRLSIGEGSQARSETCR